MLRLAVWPALALAVIGVGITAAIVAAAVMWIAAVPFAKAMLVGAAVAPTDAAAVAALLGRARLALPERINALLEVESGLNDPMSIFLTVFVIRVIVDPASATWLDGALLFAREMIGGAAARAWAAAGCLPWLLRRLSLEVPTAMVLVLAVRPGTVRPGAGPRHQRLPGDLPRRHDRRCDTASAPQREIANFFDGSAWLAQIVLFLMLGLLVTPHDLVPFIPIGIAIALVLIVVARPVATFACLLPFRFPWRESAFASWVGLRGAVPIYISFIPALADPHRDVRLFSGVFVVVVVSLVIQGWTIGAAARLFGFVAAPHDAKVKARAARPIQAIILSGPGSRRHRIEIHRQRYARIIAHQHDHVGDALVPQHLHRAIVQPLRHELPLASAIATSYTTCSRASSNDVGNPAMIASTAAAGSPTSLPRFSCALLG